jgi:hypothetical protein
MMSVYEGESLGKRRFVEPGVRIPPSVLPFLLLLLLVLLLFLANVSRSLAIPGAT